MTSSSAQTTEPPGGSMTWDGRGKKPLVWCSVVTLAGWLLIYFVHEFFRPSLVFLCLAWASLILLGYFVWSAGAAAFSDMPDEGFDIGRANRTTELENEKRSLLKAIKETEFDHQMRKLSKEDADEIIAFYRVRAIAILKELDRLEGGADSESTRAQLERELNARLSIAGVVEKGAKAAERKQGKPPEKEDAS